MAKPDFKLDPSLIPLSKSLRDSVESQSGLVSNALGKALGGSGVHGDGFKQVKDKLHNVGEQMSQAVIEAMEAGASLEDAFALTALNALNEAANENVEEALTDEMAEEAATKALKDQANAIDPNQAIDDFGKNPLPDAQKLAEAEAFKAAMQNAEAANTNTEPPPYATTNLNRDRIEAGMNKAKKKSEALQNSQDAAWQDEDPKKAIENFGNSALPTVAANDNVETEQKPEATPGRADAGMNQAKEKPTNQKQGALDRAQEWLDREKEMDDHQSRIRQEQDPEKRKDLQEKYLDYLDKEIEKLQRRDGEREAEKTKEAEKKPKPAAENPEPEDPNKKIDKALDDAGVPLVDTDEDNPMLPKKTEAEVAKEKEQAQSQGNNPDSEEGGPEGQEESEEGPPQAGPRRGIITQGMNSLKNRNRLKEIAQETKQLQTDMDANRNKINKINKQIGPDEADIKKKQSQNKWLKRIVPILWVISAVLSLFSLTLGWILTILPMLSWAATAAHKHLKKKRKKNEEEIASIQARIQKPINEREAEYKKLKANTKQIENLARERFRLKNQSLIGRNPK